MQPAVIVRNEVNREAAIRRIKALRIEPESAPWGVYIEPFQKIRTLEQNALYWRLIGIICAATGNTKQALHIYFKQEVFGVKLEIVGGKVVEIITESGKSNRRDFSELIETVYAFMAENGIEESA
jgi:hypothetical protein